MTLLTQFMVDIFLHSNGVCNHGTKLPRILGTFTSIIQHGVRQLLQLLD